MTQEIFSIPELHDHLDTMDLYPDIRVTRDNRRVPRAAWPSLSINQTLIERARRNIPSKFWFDGDVVVSKIVSKL